MLAVAGLETAQISLSALPTTRAHGPLTACCVAGAPLQAGSKAAGNSCGADSRVNPVQSVSNSDYLSAAGPGSDGGSWLAAGEDSRLGALGPSAESSYASALPVSAFRCQSVMWLAANSMQPAPYFVGELYYSTVQWEGIPTLGTSQRASGS
jgi:hypothetical protein